MINIKSLKIPSQIHSDNLILSAVKVDDLEKFYDAFVESFESLTEYYSPGWSQFKTLPPKEDMGKYLSKSAENFNDKTLFLFSVFNKKTDDFIGQGAIHHIDYSVPKMRLGFWTKESIRNQGYGTEIGNMLSQLCFDVLQCERLEIRNDLRNPGSGKIAKNLNYDYLTVFEKNKRGKNDEFWDLEIYVTFDKSKLPPLNIEYIYD